MIYFIRDTISGLVKIGFSDNPWRRLSKMQSDSAGELQLLGVIEGSRADEAELHQICRLERVRGEWFKPEGGVAEALAAAVQVAAPRVARNRGPAHALIVELCEVTGSSFVTVRGWLERGRVPGWWIAQVAQSGVLTGEQLCRAQAENAGCNRRKGKPPVLALEDMASANALRAA